MGERPLELVDDAGEAEPSNRWNTSSAYPGFSSAANASTARPRRKRRSVSVAAASRTASRGLPGPPASVRAERGQGPGVLNQSGAQRSAASAVQSGCWRANLSASHSTRAWGLRERGGALTSTWGLWGWPPMRAWYSGPYSSRPRRSTTERA